MAAIRRSSLVYGSVYAQTLLFLFCFVYFLCIIIYINFIRKWWLSFRFKLHLVISIELHAEQHAFSCWSLFNFVCIEHSFGIQEKKQTIMAWNQLYVYINVLLRDVWAHTLCRNIGILYYKTKKNKNSNKDGMKENKKDTNWWTCLCPFLILLCIVLFACM